ACAGVDRQGHHRWQRRTRRGALPPTRPIANKEAVRGFLIMRKLMIAILVAIGLAATVAYLSMFIVQQHQQALVLEFGKPKRIIDQSGLHWKLPVVETVEYFDKRILDLDTESQELFSS